MAKNINLSLPAHSPLDGAAPHKDGDYRQSEIFPMGKLIVRGDSDDTALQTAAAETLQARLPLQPNTTSRINRHESILWLGPSEWLLWVSEKRCPQVMDSLLQATAGMHAAIIDVSDYYTIIRISGNHADAVIAHGCPLDIRAQNFPGGSVTQSHFRSVSILLYRLRNGYDIQIRRSHARYLWDYLIQINQLL